MKLTYFDTRGRAEAARLLLELAGEPYQFESISIAEWRAGAKQRMLGCTPFGQLPVLEDGPLLLCQSQAILRHLARKLGRAGANAEEQARADEVCETANEILFELGRLTWEPAFADKRAAHRETTQKRLERLESYFTRLSPDGQHWVTTARLTVADVVMAYALESLIPLHPGLLEQHPSLQRAMRAFFATDGVRDYVHSERRPRVWTVPHAIFGGKPEETHHWGALHSPPQSGVGDQLT